MTILDNILVHKREEVRLRAAVRPLSELRKAVAGMDPPRGFAQAISEPPAIIAEIKRRSPAQGSFKPSLDTLDLAAAYANGGAHAISVLTDERLFGMRPSDLPTVRAWVNIPVLRKDFILDEYSVYDSRALGADAILLIVSALTPDELITLYQLAAKLGMAVLVEVHDEEETSIAVDCGATIIGINSRNLHTFEMDLEVVQRVSSRIPPGTTLVAESGIRGRPDIDNLMPYGVDAFIVGESLISAGNPGEMLRTLLGRRA